MAESPEAALREELMLDRHEEVSYPPRQTYRGSGATLGYWYADARSGCRTLQDFKKISIVEAKGYCYGWHFYQAGDADLVIASEDTLFGHPAFRYVGWGPRMWAWVQTMGLRKFQEMVFTGRPFTAGEMYDCNFVNKVVPRDQLEARDGQVRPGLFALPADRRGVPAEALLPDEQAVPRRVHGEHDERHVGVDRPYVAPGPGHDVRREVSSRGLSRAVKDNDDQFPPDFRLSKSGRRTRRS